MIGDVLFSVDTQETVKARGGNLETVRGGHCGDLEEEPCLPGNGS